MSGILKQIKNINLKEITAKAELHDKIAVKTLEIVNEINKKLDLLLEKKEVK